MGISTFPAASSGGSSGTGVYLSASATYVNLPSTLAAGAYKFVSDIDSDGIYYFKSSDGYIFSNTMRNGIMLASFPVAISQIAAASSNNTFPIYVEIFTTSITLGAAPTGLSFSWTGNNGNAQVGSLTFTPSSGATDTVLYWSDGTNTSLSTTTSPKTSVLPYPLVTAAGQSRNFIVVNVAANGLNTLGGSVSTGTAPSQTYTATYTSSTTWTAPSGVNSIQALVVAGGGGGAGGYNTNGQGGPGYGAGGGGGGAVSYNASMSVTPGTTYTLTVGSGGSAGNPSNQAGWGSGGGNGGSSSFGSLLVATNSSSNGASQGSAGSAGGTGAGAGGGSEATGSNGTSNSITGTSVVYGSGGGGGRGGFTNGAGFAGGASGAIIVKWTA